ncbi:MAG: hypothetical protein H0V00_18640 [Chloroflexia bacterium]|nr:hypothetical protein [Chloroflexia bacterium]
MKAVSDDKSQVPTFATMSARVMADAQRSFAANIDTAILEQRVQEVVSLLWTESTKVTNFIPVLALRDLRDQLDLDREFIPPQM